MVVPPKRIDRSDVEVPISTHQIPCSKLIKQIYFHTSNHGCSSQNALISPLGRALLHPAAVGRIFGSFSTASKPHVSDESSTPVMAKSGQLVNTVV